MYALIPELSITTLEPLAAVCIVVPVRVPAVISPTSAVTADN